jgi:hypothetical protein
MVYWIIASSLHICDENLSFEPVAFLRLTIVRVVEPQSLNDLC